MKIRVKRSKNGGMSLTFAADRRSKTEGVDLKDALLASLKDGGTVSPRKILKELESRGYGVEGPPRKKGAAQ